MGWKDIFSKKKKTEVIPEPAKKEIKEANLNEAYQSSYEGYLSTLQSLQEFCLEFGKDYEQVISEYKIDVPADLNDFVSNFDLFMDNTMTTIPNAKRKIEREVTTAKSKTETITKTNETSNFDSQIQDIRSTSIISDTETSKTADLFYDKAEKAYNDSRLVDYASSSLDEYEQLLNMMGEPTEGSKKRR